MLPQASLDALRSIVWEDSPDGFKIFYGLVNNRALPRHAHKWTDDVWEARRTGKPLALEAFRGSTKTTFFRTLAAYLHGNHPEKAGMFIQAGGESAGDNAANIAQIIEHNEGWKLVFPHIMPDQDAGWGAKGYFLKDTRVPYGEFVRQRIDKDPSLVGYGYTSDQIIGKHPSLYLFIDDIHNEENTRSSREMEHVKRTYAGTLMPTRKPNNPLTVLAFTPWTDNDTYHAAVATGQYMHTKTPVRLPDGSPTWPEGMPEAEISQMLAEDITGGAEFARMYMLDLSAMKKREFAYHLYPSHLVSFSWPMCGGADYASVLDPTKRNARQSHFGLAYVAKLPDGGAVVVDGVLEQVSLGEALDYVEKAQRLFPNWLHTTAEMEGKGTEFIQAMLMKPTLRVFDIPFKTGGKSKASRLVNQLGMALRSMRVRISDADTKFLAALRNFLNKYPNVEEHDPGWDAADSVLTALFGMMDVLSMPTITAELTGPKTKHPNPFSALGTQHA